MLWGSGMTSPRSDHEPTGDLVLSGYGCPPDALPECLCACRVNGFRSRLKAVSSLTMCCNNPNAEHHKHDKAEAKKPAGKKTSQGTSRS